MDPSSTLTPRMLPIVTRDIGAAVRALHTMRSPYLAHGRLEADLRTLMERLDRLERTRPDLHTQLAHDLHVTPGQVRAEVLARASNLLERAITHDARRAGRRWVAPEPRRGATGTPTGSAEPTREWRAATAPILAPGPDRQYLSVPGSPAHPAPSR